MAFLADRAKKAHASVAKLEALLLREPDNRAIQINLRGMRKHALQISKEMERLAAANLIDDGHGTEDR